MGTRAAVLAYTVLAVVLTWPLVLHLGDSVPGGANDLFQNYWNFWWWKTALVERGELPYSTDLLFAGTATGTPTSLAFHTHSEANIAWTFPFLLAFGPAVALDLATLGGFVLAGLAAFLLARELLADSRAAFLAGVVFAYFPQHFEQSLEHLNLASYGAMPLVLLCLVRGVRQATWRPWVLCALAFALNALFSWHDGLLVLPGALLVFAVELWRTERCRWLVLGQAALAAALAASILLPFAWPMLAEIAAGETYFEKPAVDKGIDAAFLFVPSSQHPLWGRLVDGLHERYRGYESAGFTAYLGLAALALVTSAAVHRVITRSRAPASFSPGIWLAFVVVYLVLALGTRPSFLGTELGLPLPFALVDEVPIARTLRIANRFLTPAMLGLALLAASAARHWIERAPRPRLAASLIALAIAADYLWIPYPLRMLERPRWIDALEAAPPGVVFDIPSGHRARAAEDMYLQTLHGRPIVGGYVSCSPPNALALLDAYPFLRSVLEAEKSPSYSDVPADPGLRDALEGLDVAVAVVHLHRSREALEARRAATTDPIEKRWFNPEKGTRREKLDEVRAELRRLWGEPRYADEEVEVYWKPGP